MVLVPLLRIRSRGRVTYKVKKRCTSYTSHEMIGLRTEAGVTIRPERVGYGTRFIYHYLGTCCRDTGGWSLPGNQKQMVTAGGTFPTVLLLPNSGIHGDMDFNRFTEKLQEAVRAAQAKAVRYGNQQIDVEHLLSALLEQEGGLASSILTRAGVNVEALASEADGELERLPKVSGSASGVGPDLRDIAAEQTALGRGGRSRETQGRIHLRGARAAGGGGRQGSRRRHASV